MAGVAKKDTSNFHNHKSMSKEVVIRRVRKSTLNTVDEVFVGGKLQFEQSCLVVSNRFGAKNYKTKNNQILTNVLWTR